MWFWGSLFSEKTISNTNGVTLGKRVLFLFLPFYLSIFPSISLSLSLLPISIYLFTQQRLDCFRPGLGLLLTTKYLMFSNSTRRLFVPHCYCCLKVGSFVLLPGKIVTHICQPDLSSSIYFGLTRPLWGWSCWNPMWSCWRYHHHLMRTRQLGSPCTFLSSKRIFECAMPSAFPRAFGYYNQRCLEMRDVRTSACGHPSLLALAFWCSISGYWSIRGASSCLRWRWAKFLDSVAAQRFVKSAETKLCISNYL